MTTTSGKPTRTEALKYYRRASERYGIDTRLHRVTLFPVLLKGRMAMLSKDWTITLGHRRFIFRSLEEAMAPMSREFDISREARYRDI